jgi:hypothetical protein
MNNSILLRAKIEVTGQDVDRLLLEHAKDEPSVSRVLDDLRGPAAKHAADELNQALDLNVFEVLAQGWGQVPAVRNAVQLSTLMQGPPAIVRLDQHKIASTLYPVLNVKVADSGLPELRLTLEINVDAQSATLAVRDGRFELLALGKASVTARLRYKSVLLKEHATTVEGALRDPFRHERAAPDQSVTIDIPI